MNPNKPEDDPGPAWIYDTEALLERIDAKRIEVNEHKLDLFMRHGPYVDYPYEFVMFRWDEDERLLWKKHYGDTEEEQVPWVSELLLEMLAFGGAERLTKEQYFQGKERVVTILSAIGVRQRRQFRAFDQVLYIETALECEAFANTIGLETLYRSKAEAVDWISSRTKPQTLVLAADSEHLHPATEGLITPTVEMFWDEDGDDLTDPANYQLQLDLVVKSIRCTDATSGLYIAESHPAVWWDTAKGVTITSDSEVLASLPGQLLAPTLTTADIPFSHAS